MTGELGAAKGVSSQDSLGVGGTVIEEEVTKKIGFSTSTENLYKARQRYYQQQQPARHMSQLTCYNRGGGFNIEQLRGIGTAFTYQDDASIINRGSSKGMNSSYIEQQPIRATPLLER